MAGVWPDAVVTAGSRGCRVFLAGRDHFCARVSNVQSYADTNRELAVSEAAARLLQQPPHPSSGSYVHESVVLGTKATITKDCIVGPASTLGIKCSVKRSVIGADCRLGNDVKVVGSVIMDGVRVEDGCHIQNTVVCAGAVLKDKSMLHNCQVGPEYTVVAGSDLRDEVVAKPRRATH